MKNIVILGGGFAGVWSALSAVRLAREIGKQTDVTITLINKDQYHSLRPRFYENDLSESRIPLTKILAPLGVNIVVAQVSEINFDKHVINLQDKQIHHYDRLILATGSQLFKPQIAGLDQYSFNVDTYAAAEKLKQHIEALPEKAERGRYTVVVVGGGSVGIEVATDICDRLKRIAPQDVITHVIVLDHHEIASRLGSQSRKVILDAFQSLGIETKTHVKVQEIAQDHILLNSGEIIDTQTVVWAAGMRASNLTKLFQLKLDQLGRLSVNQYLLVEGVANCFAAGDVAAAKPDAEHTALLSCQHAMPQGRVAGNNAVADLFGRTLTAYSQPKFVTIMDLGSYGAFCAEGWEQCLVAIGHEAKQIKNFINHDRIYPPYQQGVETLLAAAEPVFKPIKLKINDNKHDCINIQPFKARKAAISELEQLNQLIISSRAYWGYTEAENLSFIEKFGLIDHYIEANSVQVYDAHNHLIALFSFSVQKGEPWLDYFFIHPDYIGKGLGRRMWQHACQFARSKNWPDFYLFSNKEAAHFYQHMGVEIDGPYKGTVEGAVIMRYKLPLVKENCPQSEQKIMGC